VLAERAFAARLEGSCQSPIAAYASVQGAELLLTGQTSYDIARFSLTRFAQSSVK